MASVGKEITPEKFEEYLLDFSEENEVKIDIPAVMRRLKSARSELEDDMEAYHSFYSDFKLYMENDINAIDSSGNINPTTLNVFTKRKKEEIKNKKYVKEIEENKLHNNKFEIEEKLSEEKINERLEQIDFTKITIDDFDFILNYYDEIEDKLTVEEKKKFNNIVSDYNILNTDKFLQTLQKFVLEIPEGQELSQEQIQELLDLEKVNPGFFEKYGLDQGNINESFAKQRLNYAKISHIERKVISLLRLYPENGIIPKEYIINVVLEDTDVREGFEKYSNMISRDKLLNVELSKEDFDNLLNKVQGIENTGKTVANVFDGSNSMMETFEAIAIDPILEEGKRIVDESRDVSNKIEEVFNSSNIVGMREDVTPVFNISSINLSSSFEDIIFQYEQSTEEQQDKSEDILTQEEKNAQMRQENDQYMTAEMARAIDFADVTKTVQDVFEKIVDEKSLETLEQDGVEQAEPEEKAQDTLELDSIDMEDVKLEVQEEIDNSDYQQEIDEKTGIAGLFAAIANSRVGRAVKNLFKTKDAQKRLNAPVTQRTEDGLKITEYESKGSLIPTSIQARNFLRDFAVNTVETVTNFANNISNAMRGNKEDEIINKPTIINSEPVQENDKSQIVDQAQEKAETYMDNNQWAVSKEALEAQVQMNNTQATNVQNKTQLQNKDINEIR